MTLLVADVVNLSAEDEAFDLAVNIGCLNLLTIQKAMDQHLDESQRVLKNGGSYFSCNSVVDQSTSVEKFYRRLGTPSGTSTVRRIDVMERKRTTFCRLLLHGLNRRSSIWRNL